MGCRVSHHPVVPPNYLPAQLERLKGSVVVVRICNGLHLSKHKVCLPCECGGYVQLRSLLTASVAASLTTYHPRFAAGHPNTPCLFTVAARSISCLIAAQHLFGMLLVRIWWASGGTSLTTHLQAGPNPVTHDGYFFFSPLLHDRLCSCLQLSNRHMSSVRLAWRCTAGVFSVHIGSGLERSFFISPPQITAAQLFEQPFPCYAWGSGAPSSGSCCRSYSCVSTAVT